MIFSFDLSLVYMITSPLVCKYNSTSLHEIFILSMAISVRWSNHHWDKDSCKWCKECSTSIEKREKTSPFNTCMYISIILSYFIHHGLNNSTFFSYNFFPRLHWKIEPCMVVFKGCYFYVYVS